jgi:hypothetical protein
MPLFCEEELSVFENSAETPTPQPLKDASALAVIVSAAEDASYTICRHNSK